MREKRRSWPRNVGGNFCKDTKYDSSTGRKVSAPNLVGHAGSECVSVMDILTHQMAKMSQQQGVDRCFSESGALHFLRAQVL